MSSPSICGTEVQDLPPSPPQHPRFDRAPGLGPGGRATQYHLPTIAAGAHSGTPSFYARCQYCYYSSSRQKSAADATRQWRNSHARVHGITSWDLAFFHPSLPLGVVPETVSRAEGTGLVYFSNRRRASQIFDYAGLIGESRHHARTFARVTKKSKGRNSCWKNSVIPADEVALLYRRTRLTPTVLERLDPASDYIDPAAFFGIALSGFNQADPLLLSAGADFDPTSFGSLLWFWVFAVRAQYRLLVAAEEIEEDDTTWEDYRRELYSTLWDYAHCRAGPSADENSEPRRVDFSPFQVTAIPLLPSDPLPTLDNPSLAPLDSITSFFSPLACQIRTAVESWGNGPSDEAADTDQGTAEAWVDFMSDEGRETVWWNHSGRAIDESIALKGWPRVVEVWSSLSVEERASWCQRKDPARTARSAQRAIETAARLARRGARGQVSTAANGGSSMTHSRR
ncbi:hypothetical protein P7C70_g7133, partial [Phenoliferia sp. Uapishka_3]